MPTADEFETAEAKEERWTKDFGYDSHRHYWDWPMVPMDKIYSSCFPCHQETDRIHGAPIVRIDRYSDVLPDELNRWIFT